MRATCSTTRVRSRASVPVAALDPERRRTRPTASLGWDDEIAALDASEIQVPVDADDMADIMYTSGTTGLPKGVLVRHRNVAMIPNGAPHWTGRGWLHGAPLFTFAGMSFIYNPMKMGLTGLYMPKFDVDHWFDVVERDKPMMIFLVPAMAELITASPRFEAADLSAPIAVSIGSAPLAPATLKKLQDRMPQASVIELVRAHRSRARVHHDAEGRGRQAHRFGRQADAADGGEGRRSRHRRRSGRADEVGELLVRLPGQAARVLQGRRRDARRRGPTTAGCAPATSRTSTTTASSTSPAASRT